MGCKRGTVDTGIWLHLDLLLNGPGVFLLLSGFASNPGAACGGFVRFSAALASSCCGAGFCGT